MGTNGQSGSRLENLEAILSEFPGCAENNGVMPDPVPRFAAVTSEGPPESSLTSTRRLILAVGRGELAEALHDEIEEGRLAHGRVWDLDGTWYPWGNIGLAYEVRIGEELTRPVHAVSVDGEDGGLYLFADRLDAEAFCRAVRRRDGAARVREEVLHDNHGADRLIDSERGLTISTAE